jgi:hypothetical protein
LVTDTVANLGSISASTSVTRYYLSLDPTDRGRDQALLGQRSVPALEPEATSTGMATVTVAGKTKPGVYFVLACADDRHDVQESEEQNNCSVSAAMLTVTP